MITLRMASLQVGLLLVAMFANAASRNNEVRITVLDSETRSLGLDDNGVARNCDQVTFDAYCRSTTTARLVNTLLVQVDNEPPFRIACTVDSKLSRCASLPKGESFEARKEKKGFTVYYVDDKGKARKQLYTLVDAGRKPGPPAAAATVTIQAPPAADQNVRPVPLVPAPHHAEAPQSSAAQASAPSGIPAPKDLSKIRCNFSSTPSGADITVDGKYVGNTPSEIGLSVGTHVVILSLSGFSDWKRELTIAVDSAVNVTANLQKTQR